PPKRQPASAGIAVPDCIIEDAQRAHNGAGAAMEEGLLIHVLPQPFDTMAILANEHRRKKIADGGRYDRAAAAAGIAKAEALRAVSGLDADETIFAGGHLSCGEARFNIEGYADGACLNPVDVRAFACHRVNLPESFPAPLSWGAPRMSTLLGLSRKGQRDLSVRPG